MIDYSWIDQVQQALTGSKLFSATIVGAKSLAMTMLLFKIIGNFLTTAENETPKIGGIISIIGYGLVIVSSDWVVGAIEQMFAAANVDISHMNSMNETHPAKDYLDQIDAAGQQETGIAKIAFILGIFKAYLSAILIYVFSICCHLVDTAVTGLYLFQRLFLIKLFQFIFPFAIALSTTKGFEDMLPRWIKIYIGLFLLGIVYIAVLKFSNIVYETIAHKAQANFVVTATTGFDMIAMAEVGAILISLLVKLSLMGMVTKEVRGFFN